MMETSGPAEVSVEPKERKKIQFAVPNTAPTQLDPRQVEMIRRRRPTPATLFRVADQSSPEDDNSAHQWVVGENGILKPKRVSSNVYQPPSLKAVQQMAEAQMQKLGVYPHMEEEGEEPLEEEEEELLSHTAEPFLDSQEEMGMAEDQQELIKPMAMVRNDVEEEEEEDEEDEEEEDKETAENENKGVE